MGRRALCCRRGVGGDGVDAARSGPAVPPDIHKIKHVVVIMQENRSFDTYFGTYPGADGIPRGRLRPRSARRLREAVPQLARTGTSAGRTR